MESKNSKAPCICPQNSCEYHQSFSEKERIREIILEDEIHQAYNEFIYYHRKQDKRLPIGAIEQAVIDGYLTTEEIASEFMRCLDRAVVRKRNANS